MKNPRRSIKKNRRWWGTPNFTTIEKYQELLPPQRFDSGAYRHIDIKNQHQCFKFEILNKQKEMKLEGENAQFTRGVSSFLFPIPNGRGKEIEKRKTNQDLSPTPSLHHQPSFLSHLLSLLFFFFARFLGFAKPKRSSDPLLEFSFEMTTMESLIGLVNRIQRACTVLGDHGGENGTLPTLWEALPSVAVVGGQVSLFLDLSISIWILFLISISLYIH